jgi:hypothetical protein
MEQQMMREALMQGFMSEVDVIMQAYGDYDKHFLGILDKAKFEQRVKRISTISEVYIDMSLMKNDLERRLDEVDERIAESQSIVEANTWRKLRKGTYYLFAKTADRLKQAEAQIAAFRSMALVKAFEQFGSDVEQLTGVPQSKFSKIKRKVDANEAEKKKSMTDRAKARLGGGPKDDGPTS